MIVTLDERIPLFLAAAEDPVHKATIMPRLGSSEDAKTDEYVASVSLMNNRRYMYRYIIYLIE